MKLLKRSETNSQAAELKRQQIQEGSDLVQRIETLRKAHNSLLEQQKHFVEASKEELKRETTELFGQKEALRADVETLTIVRDELQRPLDDEWKKFKDAESKLNIERDRFNDEVLALEVREGTLKADQQRMEQTLEKTEAALSNADKKSKQAESDSQESEKILKDAKNKKDKIDSEIDGKLTDLHKKEKEIELERKEVEQVRELNKSKEEELNKRERQLNDKYETFKREVKRKNAK